MEDVAVIIGFLFILIILLAVISFLDFDTTEKDLEKLKEEVRFLKEDMDHARKVVKVILLRMKGDYFTEEERVALEILLGSEGLWQESES